jgi:CDP-diacylglycerol--serine O-phosphatidyltransferase
MLVVAAMLVSRVRTFSFKKLRIPHRLVLPTMLAIGIYLAFLVSAPWFTLTLTGIAYAISIPFSDRTFRSLKEAHARAVVPADPGGAEGAGP